MGTKQENQRLQISDLKAQHLEDLAQDMAIDSLGVLTVKYVIDLGYSQEIALVLIRQLELNKVLSKKSRGNDVYWTVEFGDYSDYSRKFHGNLQWSGATLSGVADITPAARPEEGSNSFLYRREKGREKVPESKTPPQAQATHLTDELLTLAGEWIVRVQRCDFSVIGSELPKLSKSMQDRIFELLEAANVIESVSGSKPRVLISHPEDFRRRFPKGLSVRGLSELCTRGKNIGDDTDDISSHRTPRSPRKLTEQDMWDVALTLVGSNKREVRLSDVINNGFTPDAAKLILTHLEKFRIVSPPSGGVGRNSSFRWLLVSGLDEIEKIRYPSPSLAPKESQQPSKKEQEGKVEERFSPRIVGPAGQAKIDVPRAPPTEEVNQPIQKEGARDLTGHKEPPEVGRSKTKIDQKMLIELGKTILEKKTSACVRLVEETGWSLSVVRRAMTVFEEIGAIEPCLRPKPAKVLFSSLPELEKLLSKRFEKEDAQDPPTETPRVFVAKRPKEERPRKAQPALSGSSSNIVPIDQIIQLVESLGLMAANQKGSHRSAAETLRKLADVLVTIANGYDQIEQILKGANEPRRRNSR